MLEKKTIELIEASKEVWNVTMSNLISESIMDESMDEETMKIMTTMNKCMNAAFELCQLQAQELDRMNQKLDELLNKTNTKEES
ncbi:MAG: hypothetical protein LIP10_03755 [Clostridiales bacterium]|nr:hypothetical protein [Clostridiales bacterium]